MLFQLPAATNSNQHSTERIEAFVGDAMAMLTGQLQALKNQVDMGQAMLSDPISTSSTAFLKMTKDWSDAYDRMLGPANPFKPAAHGD